MFIGFMRVIILVVMLYMVCYSISFNKRRPLISFLMRRLLENQEIIINNLDFFLLKQKNITI